jgi:LmbE family N-acetylglucosaminyl deacetylase
MAAADIAGFEEFDPAGPSDDGNPFGTPAAEIDLAVDVSDYVAKKRAAIACHTSQVTDTGMFLALPEELFSRAFRTEWYIDPGAPTGNGPRAGWLLD